MKCTKKLMLTAMLAGFSVTYGYGMGEAEHETQQRGNLDDSGMTPLHYAVILRRIDTVKELLEAGADVNQADKRGRTPLHYAAARGESDTVRVLLHAHANFNKADNLGMTPLHFAALNGRAHVVKMLLDAGANPNLKNRKGKTSLDCARLSRDKATIRLLIGHNRFTQSEGASTSDASMSEETDGTEEEGTPLLHVTKFKK